MFFVDTYIISFIIGEEYSNINIANITSDIIIIFVYVA